MKKIIKDKVSVLQEFKEFAMKGNLIDMAVAFVMGASFGKVVSSFIDGIVMPIVGKVTAGVDFRSLKYVLSESKMDETGKVVAVESSIKYGEFITIAIDFVLVAFFVFILVKTVNRLKRAQKEVPAPPAEPSKEQVLLAEIRDLLKEKQ